MCELNVVRQLYNVCTSPTVQAAWDRGQPVTVHAFVYSLADGLLKQVADPVSGQVATQKEDLTPKQALDKAFSTFSYFETVCPSPHSSLISDYCLDCALCLLLNHTLNSGIRCQYPMGLVGEKWKI